MRIVLEIPDLHIHVHFHADDEAEVLQTINNISNQVDADKVSMQTAVDTNKPSES